MYMITARSTLSLETMARSLWSLCSIYRGSIANGSLLPQRTRHSLHYCLCSRWRHHGHRLAAVRQPNDLALYVVVMIVVLAVIEILTR